MAEGHGVWRTLRDRDDVHVRSTTLPAGCGGGILVRLHRGEAWILIDAERPPDERRAILAHELEHLERGSARTPGAPATWHAIVAREERRVDRAVARRLVPGEALRAFVAERCSIGEPVTAGCVAEAFGVPVRVARLACELAAHGGSRGFEAPAAERSPEDLPRRGTRTGGVRVRRDGRGGERDDHGTDRPSAPPDTRPEENR